MRQQRIEEEAVAEAAEQEYQVVCSIGTDAVHCFCMHPAEI